MPLLTSKSSATTSATKSTSSSSTSSSAATTTKSTTPLKFTLWLGKIKDHFVSIYLSILHGFFSCFGIFWGAEVHKPKPRKSVKTRQSNSVSCSTTYRYMIAIPLEINACTAAAALLVEQQWLITTDGVPL